MKWVKAHHPGHFFEAGTMRFFRSRLARYAYKGKGGTFFVTSEQFVSSEGRHAPRLYTVRQLTDNGGIVTRGPFNKLNHDFAHFAARILADGGVPDGFEGVS